MIQAIKRLVPEFIKEGLRNLDFQLLMRRSPSAKVVCPICGHDVAKVFHFGPDRGVTGPSRSYPEVSVGHDKYGCVNCGNIFATWLNRDLDEVGKIYGGIDSIVSEVNAENDRKAYQKHMLQICSEYIFSEKNAPARARLLDFGCGPNFMGSVELERENKRLEVYATDINPTLPFNGEKFFRLTAFPQSLMGTFDGIASVDVFEHLNTPVEDFNKFNRMLKLNGYMVHYAPIQWWMRFPSWQYETSFHTNFPSKKAVRILAAKTGFRFVGGKVLSPGYNYIVFQKIAELAG